MEKFTNHEILTPSELKAYKMLQMVRHDSIYGNTIKEICANPDGLKIRELINELKTEAPRGSNGLKALLGPAFNTVIYK